MKHKLKLKTGSLSLHTKKVKRGEKCQAEYLTIDISRETLDRVIEVLGKDQIAILLSKIVDKKAQECYFDGMVHSLRTINCRVTPIVEQ